MGYTITIYNSALEDVIEITKWYDLQSEGLGERFIIHLEDAIQKLKTHPEAFGYSFDDVRKIKLTVFPYLIFFRVSGEDVRIYAVIHAKRKPSLYKKRLKGL